MAAKACDDRYVALQAILRTDLIAFVTKVFSELCPADEFSAAIYLSAIAYQLERVAVGDIRRLMVTVPPRHLKSITISIAWVAWCLGHAPAKRFMCVSYNTDLATKLSRDCRKIMESEWYKELFPGTVLERSTDGSLETSSGGGRFATSLGGALTGFGADVIIIDDPMKADDAMSATARHTAKEWVTQTLLSRLNDPKTGTIILVQQRLHEDDLVGHFQERGGWEHLNLPAICEEQQVLRLSSTKTHVRSPGDVLDPQRQPLELLQQLKAELGTYVFSAQYQQAPVPATGGLIKRDWLKYYEEIPKRQPGDRIVQSWDTASKGGTQHDYSVCITALVRKNTVYIVHVYRAQIEFPELVRMVGHLAELDQPDTILIEDAASGQQLIQTLEADTSYAVPYPIRCKPDADKVTRMSGCTPIIERGDLILPKEAPWLGEFLREILGFPHGKRDDQADALSQLLNHCRQRPYIRMVARFDDEWPEDESNDGFGIDGRWPGGRYSYG